MLRPASVLALLVLAGCTVPPPGETPIATVRGPVPVRGLTPLDRALACLRAKAPKGSDLRFAVHRIPDRTGVSDYDGPGKYVPQAAELMLITALARAGVRQVNRTAVAVSEWELKQALEKRLGEGEPVEVNGRRYPFRPIRMGQLLGSTHTIFGAITELDFDILSGGAEVSVGGVGAKARGYYVSLGVDVVVSDTRTTEIVWARSYRKQIWGREVEAGLFRFFDVNPGGNGGGVGGIGVELFDIRVGRQENEPIHASLRWVMAQAAYDIVRDFTGVGEVCDAFVPAPSRSEPMRFTAAGFVPAGGVIEEEKTPEVDGRLTSGAAEPSGEPVRRLPDGRIVPKTVDDPGSGPNGPASQPQAE